MSRAAAVDSFPMPLRLRLTALDVATCWPATLECWHPGASGPHLLPVPRDDAGQAASPELGTNQAVLVGSIKLTQSYTVNLSSETPYGITMERDLARGTELFHEVKK